MEPEQARREEAPPAVSGIVPVRTATLREHALRALVELNQVLANAVDPFAVAEALLLNLMGQMGTSCAAFWVVSDRESARPVMMRSYGMGQSIARALMTASALPLVERFRSEPESLAPDQLEGAVGQAVSLLAREADIALFAPVFAKGELMAVLALGGRVDQRSYSSVDLAVVEASLASTGLALHTLRPLNRHREAIRRLRMANAHLHQVDHLRGERARAVQGELIEALVAEGEELEALLAEASLPPAASTRCTAALKANQRARRKVDLLLSIPGSAHETCPAEQATVNVVDLMAAAHCERLPGAADALCEFTCATAANLPRASANAGHLARALDALLDEALRSLPPGSRITLRAARVDAGISAREGESAPRPHEGMRIDLADDGPALSDAQLDTVRQQLEPLPFDAEGSPAGESEWAAASREAWRAGARLVVARHARGGLVRTLFLEIADA